MKKALVSTEDELGEKMTDEDIQPSPEEENRRSPSRSSRQSPRGARSWFLWSVAFVLTATVSAAVGATVALVAPLSPMITSQANKSKTDGWGFEYGLSRPVNILVMGIDRVLDAPANSPLAFNGRSDTMLLLRLDPRDNSVRMLSIPRDTQVEIPGTGVTKINQANEDGGPTLAARTVSRTLNQVTIDRYVRVTTDAFREMVNLVGGIEVYVPKPMHYEDKTQKLKIDLEPGWQTLNGDQAEQFARFRKDGNGDIGRVQRQQSLLKALRQRLQSPAVLPRLPQAVRIMRQYVDTNLSLEELLALVGFGLHLSPDDVKMVLLPGRFSQPGEYVASYWIMNPQGRDRIMRQFFEQNPTTIAVEETRLPDNARIAIQNATKDPELAHQVLKVLREKGFRNTYIIEDWSDSQRQTEIIVQQGDVEAAAVLRKALSLGKVEVSSVGDLESDLTIRVGEDWLEKNPEETSNER